MKTFRKGIYAAWLLAVCVCLAPCQSRAEIHRLVESTKLERYTDITFFLRMPAGVESVEDRSSRVSPVRGCIGVLHVERQAGGRAAQCGMGRFVRTVSQTGGRSWAGGGDLDEFQGLPDPGKAG